MTDPAAEQIGPAIASRLQGRPCNVALSLTLGTRQGIELQGDTALAYPGEAVQTDGQGDALLAATESGVQSLIRILSRRYGADNQQTASGTIDMFYDLRRERLSLLRRGVRARLRGSDASWRSEPERRRSDPPAIEAQCPRAIQDGSHITPSEYRSVAT